MCSPRNLVFAWLCVISFQCITAQAATTTTKSKSKSRTTVEITAERMQANLDNWETDVAVMFYAPWCKYCQQLLPSWESIAQLSKPNKNLAVTTFNCELDANLKVCEKLNIEVYPSIAFIGYGNMNQSPLKGFIFGKNKAPRIVRYTADLYPEAIYDWVNFLTFVSKVQRSWTNFMGFFTGKSTSKQQIENYKKKLEEAEDKKDLYAKELEKYMAYEVFDSLENHGDPFPLMNELTPDERNRPLRVCVGEMAQEYCKYYTDEPYCKIHGECQRQELVPEACRPATCPFTTDRGKKVVSVCMQPSVIEQYKKALLPAEA